MSNFPTKTDTRAVRRTVWIIVLAGMLGLAFAAHDAIASEPDGSTVAAWYYRWDQFDNVDKLVKLGQIQGLAAATYETATTLFGGYEDPEARECVFDWLPASEGEIKHVITTTMEYTQSLGLDPSAYRFGDAFTLFLLYRCFPDEMDAVLSGSTDDWRST